MKIDILLNDEIIVNHRLGYYIIKKEGKGYGVYQKYTSEEITYYITAFKTLIDALKFVRTFIKD